MVDGDGETVDLSLPQATDTTETESDEVVADEIADENDEEPKT